jgi:hypothetical protein
MGRIVGWGLGGVVAGIILGFVLGLTAGIAVDFATLPRSNEMRGMSGVLGAMIGAPAGAVVFGAIGAWWGARLGRK